MNIRKTLYFSYLRSKGSSLPRFYGIYRRQDEVGIPPDQTQRLLVQMLTHCQQAVPYYAQVMRELGGAFQQDPEAYLAGFPILTKDILRGQFQRLQSADLPRRRWYHNTSGGSTGDLATCIQDQDYMDRSYPITLLFSEWAGKELGEPELRIWGSERDILQGSMGWRAVMANRLTNITYYNAFRMTPDGMRQLAASLNAAPPKLIVAYVDAANSLAKFLARENVAVRPQSAMLVSAGTLYPFMREQIESVFQCRVFDRYGCRELGDIACQCGELQGLHVAPWGNYIEVVDDEGRRVPNGVEGEILVTSLTNFAMPLIRYRIGDRGILSTRGCTCGRPGQILERIVGRHSDTFRRRDGTLIEPGYFVGLTYGKEWIAKQQVIQKSESLIVYRMVPSGLPHAQAELDEIAAGAKRLMGDDCEIRFEFVDDIESTPSGKYRYAVSEIET